MKKTITTILLALVAITGWAQKHVFTPEKSDTTIGDWKNGLEVFSITTWSCPTQRVYRIGFRNMLEKVIMYCLTSGLRGVVPA